MKLAKQEILLTIVCLLIEITTGKSCKPKLGCHPYIRSILPVNFAKHWLEPMVLQLVEKNDFHSVVVRTLNISKLNQQFVNVISEEFTKIIPTICCDKIETSDPRCNETTDSFMFKYPTGLLNVIFLDQNYQNDLEKNSEYHLNWIADNSQNWTRSKTLTIVLGSGGLAPMRKTFKKICVLAWSQKFLDFSILLIPGNQGAEPSICYYQMFEKKNYFLSWKENVTIFPEKMQNLKGSNFTMSEEKGEFEKQDLRRDRAAYMASLSPSDYTFAKYVFCHVHNCILQVKSVTSDTEANVYYKLKHVDPKTFRMLDTFTPDPCYRMIILLAAIPHHGKTHSITELGNLSSFIGIMITMMICLKLMVRVLRLNHKIWNVLKMYSCILGSIIKGDKSIKGKFLLLFLIFIAFYVSNGLVELATKFELDNKKESITNMEDLNKLARQSNLSITSNHQLDVLLNGSIDESRFLFMYNVKGLTPYDCYGNLSEKNDRICIFNEEVTRIGNGQLLKRRKGGLRTAAFGVRTSCATIYFERGSPYAKQYMKLVYRALDHGILRRQTAKEVCAYAKTPYGSEDYDIVPVNGAAFYWSMFRVLLFCHVVTSIIFLAEIFGKRIYSEARNTYQNFRMRINFTGKKEGRLPEFLD